jgi:signal transduction histidine kinase
LTVHLLNFSKTTLPVTEMAPLQETIHKAVRAAVEKTDIRAEFAIDPSLWPVAADLHQIRDALRNITLHAVRASDEEGRVRIEATNQWIPEGAIRGLEPGPYVRIAVRDWGAPIPPEDLPRFFDPYFNRGAAGDEFGLATACSIVRRHRGKVEVESEREGGTTIRFYLPGSPNDGPRLQTS